jgi:hypothetical protein
LIQRFSAITDVPMVLNTSFNENEPVVCYPEEALDCFLRTQMDVLVLGEFFLERNAVSVGVEDRSSKLELRPESAKAEEVALRNDEARMTRLRQGYGVAGE